jgi:superfamily I DNA/RNA helicase
MEFIPTKEQEAIIGAALIPQCVIACPGSGKTATAVRRLVEIRRRLGDSRGYVALFSYSNIAVETFRREYHILASTMPGLSRRVLIETVDSFLTTYVLLPHGARTMGALRQPFLVQGTEPFLSGFKVSDGNYPHDITELRVKFAANGSLECTLQAEGKQPVPIDELTALHAIEKLGRTGAYTHEFARYWAIRTLAENERLLRALCRRYPHVLVDEAQDVGPLHGLLVTALIERGTGVSLIGDPNQGIYNFAGADGSFLRDYSKKPGVINYPLSQNRRSVSSIIEVANRLVDTKSTPFREHGHRKHGAYYLSYDEAKLDALIATFAAILEANQYARHESVIVCRGNPTVAKLTGGASNIGQGATGHFARAAVLRDRNEDIGKAFECSVNAVLRLLKNAPEGLRRDLLSTSAEGDVKTLRRLLWGLLRSSTTGIPDARLPAKPEWHPTLKTRVDAFLATVEAGTDYIRSASWASNVTVAKLTDVPLWQVDLGENDTTGIRVDTVHQVKGEGIPVVLYLARTKDITKLLQGATSEDGRIGYVAVTRARDLLLLAVPNTAKKSVLDGIEAKGFKPWVN